MIDANIDFSEDRRGHPPSGRRPLNSLSTRVIFFVFLSTFLTALVVSWISIHAIHSHLRAGVESRFPALLERRAAALEAYLEQGRSGLARAAEKRPDLLAGRASAAQAALERRMAGNDALAGAVLFDARGRARAATGGLDADWLSEALAGETAPDLSRRTTFAVTTPDGGLAIFASIPLAASPAGRAEGEAEPPPTWPRLVGAYRLEALARYLAPESDRGPGTLTLISADGHRVAGAPLATRPDVPLPVERLTEAGGLVEYTRADGEHVLAHAQPLLDGQWLLVVEAPFEEVFAPVLSVVARIFLTDLVIILAFSFVAYKITATIMQPIEALSEGALRVSQGDIDHDIPTRRTNDEIGLLTRAFNDMMHELRDSQRKIEEDKLRLTEQNEELQSMNEVLAQLSITDGLTKLHNHRYFQDHLTREIKRLSRTGDDLSMILLDLDDFKKLNDRHGHAAGDEVLVRMARLMNECVRETDLLARYGGEEFVILAPGTDLSGAVALAEKVRMSAESSPQIIDESYRAVTVTVSCGVAQYRGDRKTFFREADRALYRAKAEGKNCVVAAEPEDARGERG